MIRPLTLGLLLAVAVPPVAALADRGRAVDLAEAAVVRQQPHGRLDRTAAHGVHGQAELGQAARDLRLGAAGLMGFPGGR